LLTTKLNAPAGTRPSVIRRTLLDRLDRTSAKLVVVVAPAGWGKTTLLRDWRGGPHSSATSWLSLDPTDNDPVRFWSYVIAALQTSAPGCGARALRVLVAQGGAEGTFLPELLAELSQAPGETVLVLDDYHVISNREIQKSVEFVVHHLPPNCRMVIATRADPSLPLARMRVRGDLDELRAADLRFSDAETAALFNDVLGIAVTEGDVAGLQHRTEGWAAGLCLAGLSMRNHPDRARYIESFAGDDRQVVDYLITEVVDGLAPETRSFLLQTSILGRLSGPLCDALTGGSDSQDRLEELERSNLFLVPLDYKRQWYRYHHLFADLLRSELQRTAATLLPGLHHRASQWYAANGAVPEAVDHAIWGGDLREAGELVAANWNVCFSEGLVVTVQSWLDRLPVDMVLEDARLCLTRGWVARHTGNLGDVERWAQAAERGRALGPLRDGISTIESSICLLRAGHRYMVGDLSGGEGPARRALQLEAAGAPRWRATALVTLGANLTWQGKVDEARDLLTDVVPRNQPPTNNLAALWAHGCLAAVAARSGDLDTADHHLGLAGDLAARHRLGEYSLGSTVLLASAHVLRVRGELGEAESAARRALELAARGGARLETAQAHLSLAATLSQGNPREARSHLDHARRILATCADPGGLADALKRAEALSSPVLPEALLTGSEAAQLSKRERYVLRLMSTELSLREIAAELFVSYNTVKSQTRAIYRKLGVSTRAEAVARAATLRAPDLSAPTATSQ
jgi:LuxR family maltose regulon positive regulatory protein